MSELIILGYPDHETAEKASQRVLDLQRDFVVELSGLATVRVDADGKKHVDIPANVVGASAASGAMWGMLVGVLFLIPAVGFLVGGAFGVLSGKLSKAGINKAFRERVEDMLEPGHAAVVVMARKVTEDKFASAMGDLGGQVLQTSLSEAQEQELASELSGSGS